MIKDSKYRPLFIKGKGGLGICNLFSVVIEEKVLKTKDNVKIVMNSENFEIGYGAYIFQTEDLNEKIVNYLMKNKISYIYGVNEIKTLVEKDVVEMNPENFCIRVVYRADSKDNFLMLTNKCNNNCIMCPDSVKSRTQNKNVHIEFIKRHIDLIDSEAEHLCITGGEPTLLQNEFIEILRYCKEKHPSVKYLLLSNGRMFYHKEFTEAFIKSRPKDVIIGIPIHGHMPELHDYIAGIKGSFVQSIYGIKNLYDVGEKIEVRIVVNKLNYKVLPNIAAMISNYFPKVLRVNFMAMEMLGSALVNKESVWINFNDVQDSLRKAIFILLNNGVQVRIYNFPLCSLDKNLWSLNVRSISDFKIRYKEECRGCSVINKCGGFFNSTINLDNIIVKPITK